MTEDRGPQRRPRRASSRSTTIKLTLASLTAAAALTGGLAAQMASGHDPALGSGQKASEPATKPRGTASAQPESNQPAPSPPASVVTTAS